MKDEIVKYLTIDSSEINKQLYNVKRNFIFNDGYNTYISDRIIDAKEIFDKYNVSEELQKLLILFLEKYEDGQEITRDYLLSNDDIRIKYERLLYDLKQLLRQIQGKKFKLIDSSGNEYLSDIPGTLGGNKKLKIYGKLDCLSANRWILNGKYVSNRVFFENEEVAIAAGYRPCAVCMPNEYKEWKNNQKIKKITLIK